MLASHFLPNSYTYNCFLDYFTTQGDLETAKDLYFAMLRGSLANIVTVNTLIKGFCKVGQIQEAIDLIRKSTEYGFSPDCISYSTVIHELCKKGDTNKAFELWNEMLYKGLKPDIVAYNILIRWCNIHGEIDMGLGIYNDMIKQGVQPNWRTYRALLLGTSVMTSKQDTILLLT
jgi:pentatricopeptide repeat protein